MNASWKLGSSNLITCISVAKLGFNNSLTLRQSYAKHVLRLTQQIGRCVHAKQLKRMRRGIKQKCARVKE